MKPMPKNFREWLSYHLKDANDMDKIDVNALYDRSLSVLENRQNFESRFACLFKLKAQAKIPKKEVVAQETARHLEHNVNELSTRFGIELKLVS